MAQSEANRVKLRYARESTWGETPNTPATTELRLVSEAVEPTKNTVSSQEIRSNRTRRTPLEVGVGATGPVAFELTYGDFEAWFETLLRNDIASTTVSNAAVIATASGLAITGGTGLDAFQPDQHIRINSTGYADDQAVARVVSATASSLVVAGTTLTASTMSANITGRTLVNGTTKHSYFLEVDFEDNSAVKYFTGVRQESGSLEIAAGQVITGSFTLRGKRGFYASATQASSVVTSATVNEAMTGAVNVGTVFENDVALTSDITAVTINFNNNMRDRPAIGDKASKEHGDGGLDVTGEVNFFFDTINQVNKMVNHTTSSLIVPMEDSSGNSIVVTIPALKYTGGAPTTPGIDTDVFLPLAFGAFEDPNNAADQVRIDFLPASV